MLHPSVRKTARSATAGRIPRPHRPQPWTAGSSSGLRSGAPLAVKGTSLRKISPTSREDGRGRRSKPRPIVRGGRLGSFSPNVRTTSRSLMLADPQTFHLGRKTVSATCLLRAVARTPKARGRIPASRSTPLTRMFPRIRRIRISSVSAAMGSISWVSGGGHGNQTEGIALPFLHGGRFPLLGLQSSAIQFGQTHVRRFLLGRSQFAFLGIQPPSPAADEHDAQEGPQETAGFHCFACRLP